ncbi:MAG: hypothetical protein L0Y56_02700 [Nitrospira sp.]|nr:hypothetical protein [Nitrospira sp.]
MYGRILIIVVLLAIFVGGLVSVARAQERQIGVGFSKAHYTNLDVDNPTFSLWADTAQPLGHYVVVNAKFDYERYRNRIGEYYDEELPGSNTKLRSDIRYYPIAYGPFKPFALAGFQFQHTSVKFPATEVSPAYNHTVNYLNPILGLGLNFENKVVAQYFYAFDDVLSDFKANGHYVRVDGYIPLGKSSWRGRAGFEFSRRGFADASYYSKVYEASVGVSKTF